MKPKLLDLFCCAAGSAKGYQRAGFYVVGVDIKPQPHYCGDEFYQADALEFPLDGYDAYHASPPCQAYSRTKSLHSHITYPDLVGEVRTIFIDTGKPYVIENVVGEPYLRNPLKLNGAFFGKFLRRTRYFETNFLIDFVLLPVEAKTNFRMGRPVKEGDIITPVGHFSNIPYAREVMGIDWMNQAELAQAIPPAYTEYIGKCLIKVALELKV